MMTIKGLCLRFAVLGAVLSFRAPGHAGAAAAAAAAALPSALTWQVPLAAGDGVTDDSAAIQAVLTAAGNAGGGTVVLSSAKRYAIGAGVVTLPFGVTLKFDTGAATGIGSEEVGGAGPITGGGQFVLLGGDRASDTAPAYITLPNARSALLGAQFYDPEELTTLTAPVVKPFAIRVAGCGCTVGEIDFINVYRGLDVLGGGRGLFRNLTGNPLSLGVRIDKCFDTTRVENCQFVDSYVRGTSLAAWFATPGKAGVRGNSEGYLFLDNDELLASKLFSFNYSTGLELAHSSVTRRTINPGSYGSLSDSGFDCAYYGILDSATQTVGFLLANTGLVGANGSATGNGGSCYCATATKVGLTSLEHCSFWEGGVSQVTIGGGEVRLHDCAFSPDLAYNGFGIHVVSAANIDLVNNVWRTAEIGSTILVEASAAGCTGRIKDNWITSPPEPAIVNSGITTVDIGTSLAFDNTDFTNLAGADSHLTLSNQNIEAGQTSISFVFGSALEAKLRGDHTGNLTVSAGPGAGAGIYFYVNGDYRVGTQEMLLPKGGGVYVGTDASPAAPGNGNLQVQGAITPGAVAFANRVRSPKAGAQQMFTDSTTQEWGAIISGGGKLPALGLYDGTNWTVIGK